MKGFLGIEMDRLLLIFFDKSVASAEIILLVSYGRRQEPITMMGS